LREAVGVVERELLATDRKLVVRLIIREGHRFHEISGFYYEEVIARVMRLIRRIAERGQARGEFTHDALARFPQLAAGPFLLAVVWDGLFADRDPLDLAGLLQAHVDVLVRGLQGP